MIEQLDKIWVDLVGVVSAHPFLTFIVSMVSIKLISISPLQINPWGYIKKKIINLFKSIISEANKDFNKTFNEQFENIRKNITEINVDIIEIKNEMTEFKTEQSRIEKERLVARSKTLRKSILDFYDDVMEQHAKGSITKSQKSFEIILFTTYKEYEDIIEELGLENGIVDDAISYLTDTYHDLRDNGTFLNKGTERDESGNLI